VIPDKGEMFYDLPVTASPNILLATPAPEVADVVLQPSPSPTMPVPDTESLDRSQNDTPGSFDAILTRVFGAYSAKAYRVADCETGKKLSAGLDPFELNRTEAGAAGEVSIWQIHPVHFWKYDRARLQSDLEYAAQAAWEISGYGTNWTGPWAICGWQ